MSTRSTICDQIIAVAEQQNKRIPPLKDELVLLESGLDSLCFAILVVRLEDALGFDPFSEQDELIYPVTLADFVQFYDKAHA
jgi:acyl carrier protein